MRFSLAIFLIFALAATAPAADSSPADARVLVHASDGVYWVAQVAAAGEGFDGAPLPETTGGGTSARSAIRMRQLASGDAWMRVGVLFARVTDIAHRGTDAVVLLEDGSWLQVWPGGTSTGPRLPDGAILQHLASDELSLWALGVIPQATTTQPGGPEEPRAGTLAVYQLMNGQWQSVGKLPAEIPADRPTTLEVFDGRPIVAWLAGPRRLEFLQFQRDGRWESFDPVTVEYEVATFRLLGRTPIPMLWTAGGTGPGELRARREAWAAPVKLVAPELSQAARQRAIEFFGGNFRLVVWSGGKLQEQSFSTEGAALGGPVDLGRTPAPPSPQGSIWPMVAMATLAMLLASGIVRRDEEAILILAEKRVRIAPMARRMIAGLIDLWPVLATAAWLMPWSDMEDMSATLRLTRTLAWLLVGTSAYLVLTTALELLLGRSLGKLICRLRVVGLDGEPASKSAVVVRNLVRPIDVFPGMPLVILVLFTPLRQRLGDVLAGTVVVAEGVIAPAGAEEPKVTDSNPH